MQEGDVALLLREAMLAVALVGAPPLLAALVIGFGMSLLQAVTQINEATLAFVPKVIGVGLAVLVAGGFMVASLDSFTLTVFDRIVAVGGR
jgi:flagellar biosynthetic protein FliQ